MPKSGTELFLRPGEPHHFRKGVLEGRSPRRSQGRATSESFGEPSSPNSHSSVNSPGSHLSPRSAALSASTQAPFSPASRPLGEQVEELAKPASPVTKTEFGTFDLLCLGGTIESLAAATEAVALNAKVCLVEPFAGIDNRAVFRLALRSCLRKQLGGGVVDANIPPASFDQLRQEREVYTERLSATRRALVKQGGVVLTCSTASFKYHKGGSSQPTTPKPLRSNHANANALSPRVGKEGVAYTPRHGVRHPANTRGARGTWWSSNPPELQPSEEKPTAADKEGLHVLLENATQARLGCVSAAHYLIAAGERSLLQNNGATADSLEGHELCTQPEDLLETFTPGQAPLRLCVIGSGWMAVELCAFCELAGAAVTWFLEQVDSRAAGEDHLAEMLPRLVQQVKARGHTQVHTDFSPRFVRVVKREGLLYVQAKHGNADCCGPFDTVLLFGKAGPVLHGLAALPNVELGRDGRLLVEPNGAAGPQVSAIGEVAALRLLRAKSKADVRNPTGLIAFGNDEQGLLSQGRCFAKLLLGGTEGRRFVAPALRTSTALSYPPVGLVGMSGDEARTVFAGPEWTVSASFSRHQLSGGIFGHFVVGLTCVQAAGVEGKEGGAAGTPSSPFVVGAALIAESGGLALISGLLLGFAVAVESKVPLQSFDRILAAYPLVDHNQ